MRKLTISLAVASVFAAFAPAASAVSAPTSASYSFVTCLTGACGNEGTIVDSVATLTLTQTGSDVSFLFQSTSPVIWTASTYISALYFNGAQGGGLTWGSGNASSDTLPSFSIDANSSLTSKDGYNWDILFPTAAAQDRLLSSDQASWTISGVSLSSFTDAPKMMLALNGLPGTSAATRIGAVVAVPEPETYAMFLAGLGIIGAVARRRRINA